MTPSSPNREHVPQDSVDALLASWRERRPDLDFEPLGVVARLGRLGSHIDRELQQLFRAHGLGMASFSVLVTLARIEAERGVSQRRLADELGLTSGTISVRIDRLVEAGLVDRRADPDSGRNALIRLTERGRELFERAAPAHLANEQRLLVALTDAERQQLASLLRKLLVEFEGSRPPADAPLGLTLAPAHSTIALRESVGLPPAPGLLVRAVHDGPAARAGVRTGDVLMRAGTHELRGVSSLYAAIDAAAGTGRLRVTVLRGVDEQALTVRFAPVSGSPRPPASSAGHTARGEHLV